MHRIDTDTRAIDLHGPGKDGFQDENLYTSPPTPPTQFYKDWLNDIQEAPARAIEGAGIALVKGDGEQLLEAMLRYANRAALQTWSPRTVAGSPTYNLVGLAGDIVGNLVAVGQSGGCKIQLSQTAGRTWVESTDARLDEVHGITYGGGQFVVLGFDATGGLERPRILRSADGVSWAAHDLGSTGNTNRQRAIAYDGVRFVTVGDGGESFYSASPFTTWTSSTTGTTDDLVDVTTDGSGAVFAVATTTGTSDDGSYISTDDVTSGWSAGTFPNDTGQLARCCAYGGGRWAVFLDYDWVYVSDDRSTWERHGLNGRGTEFFRSAEYAGGVFLAVNDRAVTISSSAQDGSWGVFNVSDNDEVFGIGVIGRNAATLNQTATQAAIVGKGGLMLLSGYAPA